MPLVSRASSGLEFRLLKDARELQQIENDWRALLEGNSRHAPMLDPHWLLPWWTHYHSGRELAVGVFRKGPSLVGIAPFCSRTFQYPGGLKFRRLELLGSGLDEPDGVCSDYLGIVARQGLECAVFENFFQHLREGAFGTWDECVLDMMNAEHPMADCLAGPVEAAGYNIEKSVVSRAPFSKLAADWETYLQTRSHRHRRLIRSALRDFEAWVSPDGYTLQQVKDLGSVKLGLGVLSALHAERWKSANMPGVFSARRFMAFHYEVAERLLRDGKLKLAWLSARGEPLAAIYCLLGNNSVYFYQSGRKMDVPAKIRPGIVLFALCLQDAIKDGFEEFDFLGGQSQYKDVFATGYRDLVRIRIARPGIRETTRLLLKGARDKTLALHRRFAGEQSERKGSQRE